MLWRLVVVLLKAYFSTGVTLTATTSTRQLYSDHYQTDRRNGHGRLSAAAYNTFVEGGVRIILWPQIVPIILETLDRK
jgi:hypothetical protein